MLILLTERKLFERSVCLGGKEIISLLDVYASEYPLCGLSKLLRTGTETKAVGYEWSLTLRSNQEKKATTTRKVADLIRLAS